jgi:hypothetical protein
MSGLSNSTNQEQYGMLAQFLELWPLDRVRKMSLEEYSNVGDKNTFCYWLEFEAECLGRIGGKPSNKFGIWKRKIDKEIDSKSIINDERYAWYKKYGSTAQGAFIVVRGHIVNIIESAQNEVFGNIDNIDLDSLSRWKIAFIYSNLKLMPIYKKNTVKIIAKHLEYPNYNNAALSELHQFIVQQKPQDEDFFDFYSKQYEIATKQHSRNYYIIGSKYEDEGNYYSILDQILKRSIVATGFVWGYDLSTLYNKPHHVIHKWFNDNVDQTNSWFANARRTLTLFLNLQPGDIIAVKSQGMFNGLTITAYAEVKEVDCKVYEFDGSLDYPDSLGHIVHVEFLEIDLNIQTGLNYGQTIHKIIPGEREGHFEKIFGSYAALESKNAIDDSDVEEDIDNEQIVEHDRINDKNTEPSYRKVAYSKLVSKTHNKIQIAFARQLKMEHPDNIVRTETNYIDIKRESQTEIFYYEVKPYNSAYNCVRAGIGQLLDYCFMNPSKSKIIHLRIVGISIPTPQEIEFIDYIKKSINISFDYIHFNIELK